jgi:Phospholipase D Active site motif
LGEAAESVDVRVLLRAGAPVPVFAPRWSLVRAGRDELARWTRIKAALDSHDRPMPCHHEKLVMVNDEVAFVGGIDLTDLGGNRHDTPKHPGAHGRMGWRRSNSPTPHRTTDTSDHRPERRRRGQRELEAAMARTEARGAIPVLSVVIFPSSYSDINDHGSER